MGDRLGIKYEAAIIQNIGLSMHVNALRAELLERAEAHEEAVSGRVVRAEDVKREIQDALTEYVQTTGMMAEFFDPAQIKATRDGDRIEYEIPVSPALYWEIMYDRACRELADRCALTDPVIEAARAWRSDPTYNNEGRLCDALRAMEPEGKEGNDG